MRTALFVLLFMIGAGILSAQTPIEYIAKYHSDAQHQMKKYGIPASITLAQGILESASGTSKLAVEANNHFGIKCHTNWTGEKVYQDDDAQGECFRKYKSVDESYEDHSLFLKKPRYEELFLLKSTDYKGWANGLKKCGYATNPKYPEQLIDLIERYQLYSYDVDGPAVAPLAGIDISDNNIKYVSAKKGETLAQISSRIGIGEKRLCKYNDLPMNYVFSDKEVVYIQPKRRHAQVDEVTVKTGQTLRDISQLYGVRMKSIQKKNHLAPGQAVTPGMKVKL